MFDGATNGERFPTYVTDILVPARKLGDAVILDKLGAHEVTIISEDAEAKAEAYRAERGEPRLYR